MSQDLEDFFISFGFKVDRSSQQQIERDVAKTEARLTDMTVAELERRRKAEDKALADRINAVTSVGAELDAEEKAAAARFIKIQQDTAVKEERLRKEQADKAQKLEHEAAKKSSERRAAGLKDTEAALLRFTGLSAAIGAVTSLTVGGIFAGMQRVAAGLEQLNYAGQRSGSAPTKFSAFAYGIQQLGGNLEGAQGSLENFGDRLKMNPQGYEQVLRRLGIRTRDPTGRMRDSADLATDTLQALNKLPSFEARNYADTLGIDDLTRRAGGDPQFPGILAQRRAEQGRVGLDKDQAAKDATAFEQSSRHLQAVFDDIATKIEEILANKFRPALDRLAAWMVEHGHTITDMAQRLTDAVSGVIESFAESGAFQKSVHAITSGLQTFAKFVASDDFSSDVKAFATGIGALAKAVVQALKWLGILPGSANAATLPEGGGFAGGEHASLNDAFERGRHGVPDSTTMRAFNTARSWGLGAKTKPGWWTPERQAHAYEKLRAGGLSDAGAKGLISRWMNVESPGGPDSVNPKSGARGIAQWLGPRGYDVPSDFDGQLDKMIREFHTTERDAFRVLSTAKNAAEGAVGASMTERAEGYNPVTGEDAYTGVTAQGVPRVVTSVPASAPASPPVMNGKPKLPPNAVGWGQDSKGNPVPINAQGHALKMDGSLTSLMSPFGVTPSVQQSIDNSRTRGDTTINAPQTFNIQGSDVKANLSAAKLAAGRGWGDTLRNLQGAMA